jgi:hypothetical protein
MMTIPIETCYFFDSHSESHCCISLFVSHRQSSLMKVIKIFFSSHFLADLIMLKAGVYRSPHNLSAGVESRLASLMNWARRF